VDRGRRRAARLLCDARKKVRPNTISVDARAWDDFARIVPLGELMHRNPGDGESYGSGRSGHKPSPPAHKPVFHSPPVRPRAHHPGLPVHKPTPTPPAPKPLTCPIPPMCVAVARYGPAPCYTPVCAAPQPPSGDFCPQGVVDAAGNCVPAQALCPPGFTSDAYGSCIPPDQGGGAPADSSSMCPNGVDPATGNCLAAQSWLTESTLIPGVENLWVAGAGAIAAYFLFFRGKK
jgi:hypothetical protein